MLNNICTSFRRVITRNRHTCSILKQKQVPGTHQSQLKIKRQKPFDWPVSHCTCFWLETGQTHLDLSTGWFKHIAPNLLSVPVQAVFRRNTLESDHVFYERLPKPLTNVSLFFAGFLYSDFYWNIWVLGDKKISDIKKYQV